MTEPKLPTSTEDIPAAESKPPVDALRELLNDPKPRDEDWQAAAGRVASVLAVGFLQEPDEHAALRAVALITHAQITGSKDAKKRALKLSRWAEAPPPPLTTLPHEDERAAALSALAKLNAPWTRSYVQECLADPQVTDDLVPDLLRWARSTFADPASFARDWCTSAIAACKTPERWVAVLKEAPRQLKAVTPQSVFRAASGLSAVIAAAVHSPAGTQADDKLVAGAVASLTGLVQDQCASAPALLLQPTLPVALNELRALAQRGRATKLVAGPLEVLSLATVSLLAAEVSRDGDAAISRWQRLVPAWRTCYPKFEEHLEVVAVELPVARQWLDGKPVTPAASTDPYVAESVFARLLPAFEAFVAELPDRGRAASLSATLAEAAALVGVEALCRTGEELDYDPLAHHLSEENAVVPRRVRVVRAGVQARRADGSTRVLVHALVTPA